MAQQTALQPADTSPAALPESSRRLPAGTLPRVDPWAAVWLLGLGLVAEVVIWWGFVQPYRLDQWYSVLAPYPVDLARISRSTPESANAWAATWLVLFAVLYIAYRRAPVRPTATYWAVLGLFMLLFSATLLLMQPVGAADLFDQIFRGRILGHYGANPFTVTPSAYPLDPLRYWVGGWAVTTSPYGPLWELPAGLTSWLAGDDLWTNLLAFKGLVVLAYGLATLALAGTLRRLQPAWAARGVLLFAWNPLVLFETPGNGHNDMLMIAFLAVACYLLARGGRWAVLAPAALMAATLVKFVPILLFPVLLLVLWLDDREPGLHRQRRLERIAVGLGLALLVAVAAYAPFWVGTRTIGALARQDLFTASIPKVIVDYLNSVLARPGMSAAQTATLSAQVGQLVRTAAQWVVLIWVGVQSLWLVRAVRRGAGGADLITAGFRAMYEVLFVYLMFATLWFQPWYLQWLIILAPLTLSPTRVTRTFLFTLGGIANYFVWDFLWIWNKATFRTIQITAAVAINAAPLLYTIYAALRPRAALPPTTIRSEDRDPGPHAGTLPA